MNNSNRKQLFICLLAGFFTLLTICSQVHAGANELISQTDSRPIRWNNQDPISYLVNPNGVAGFTTDLQKIVIVGAVDDSFRAWTNIPGASIHFTNHGSTQVNGVALDGANVVSFQDPGNTHSFPPGVLAVTVPTYATSTGVVVLPNGKQITVQFPGQIIDADILFNPTVTFSPNGMNGADIVAILTHEVGHLLGLDHTGVLSSIMDPFGESGTASANRGLQMDDMLTAASNYPDLSFSPAPGTISGTVTASNGTPVQSADVVAVTVPGGVPLASQLSGADGSYRITGLPAGNYQILVEPLDGPITLQNFPGFYSLGQNNFATTLFGGPASPTTVPVASGQTSSANVVVPVAPLTLLNITEMAANLQSQAGANLTFSSAPLYLPRGKAYQLTLAGNNVTTDSSIKFSAPSADITLQGATTGATLVGGQPVRQQNIAIGASAALGPSNLSLSNSSSTSVMPGGIVVTVNPRIDAIVDAAVGGKKLAPGSIFSIYGSDPSADLVPQPDNWLGAPAPTSLGGVSVKVGDRYAPLFFACPGPAVCGQYQQINGLIPFEATPGSTVAVTIQTGPNAAGNTVNVTLSPTAPAIFMAGATQGAILNGDQTVTAAVGTFPGSHPAKAGDVIVIYCEGLGPVTPTLPSGPGSGSNGSPYPQLIHQPQVLIGGVAVTGFDFAGLSPGFVGLYQLNAHVPAGIAPGNAVPVQITTFEGQTSNTATIAIQ